MFGMKTDIACIWTELMKMHLYLTSQVMNMEMVPVLYRVT